MCKYQNRLGGPGCDEPKAPHALTREQAITLERGGQGAVGVALRLCQTIAQQAQRIQELEEQRVKYGPICLNCGKDKPCMTEAEASQHGGSTPCTFDPAPKELWQRCKQLQATLAARERDIDKLKADLNEMWVDERGTVWTRPTAWAYAQVCRVKDEQKETITRLEDRLEESRFKFCPYCGKPIEQLKQEAP